MLGSDFQVPKGQSFRETNSFLHMTQGSMLTFSGWGASSLLPASFYELNTTQDAAEADTKQGLCLDLEDTGGASRFLGAGPSLSCPKDPKEAWQPHLGSPSSH